MEDALDFIGWYNHRTRRQLGIPLTDAQRLYLAYHEGQGGYRRGTWRDKPKVQRAAGGSLRPRIVIERSLCAVNPAFGAVPGIKSGRSAANRRSAPSRYAGALARMNPHAKWRVFTLKGVETTWAASSRARTSRPGSAVPADPFGLGGATLAALLGRAHRPFLHGEPDRAGSSLAMPL